VVGDRIFSVSAVYRVPGEEGIITQVFAAAQTISAAAAGEPEPGYADALPRLKGDHLRTQGRNTPHDLVTRYEGKFRMAQVPIQDVKIRAAYAAGMDFHEDLAG
jgi:hypothetical protein